jgi:hypothetical protein
MYCLFNSDVQFFRFSAQQTLKELRQGADPLSIECIADTGTIVCDDCCCCCLNLTVLCQLCRLHNTQWQDDWEGCRRRQSCPVLM